MYSKRLDRQRKFLFTLRSTVPTVLLIILLVVVTFVEQHSWFYNFFLLFSGLLASVYFLYYMFFSNVYEKITDDITGAFSRNYFVKLLPKYRGSLLLLSIDNIKEINERYGIENGDKVLWHFSDLIDTFFKKRLHKELPICRFKSGDFLVVVPSERVKGLAKEFINRYDNTFIDNIQIKLSSAFSTLEEPKATIDRLYEKLYYCQSRCDREKRSDLQKRIEELIEKERLFFLFQPALNLKTNRYDLVEVIVKLKDDKSIIHPSQYFPIINRSGLENRFDLLVSKKLLKMIENSDIKQVTYSFNLSPYSVRNRRFSEEFFNLFTSSKNFIIKLLEPNVYKDIAYYKKVLERYKGEGLKIGFEHFGSCNAAMEYVKNIDIDYIFFDKYFTKNIHDKRTFLLLRAWVDLFSKLGVKSVIKFIDDPLKIDDCKEIGVDYIQGFALAKAMEFEELQTFLKEHDALR